jgi:hypothetical protein
MSYLHGMAAVVITHIVLLGSFNMDAYNIYNIEQTRRELLEHKNTAHNPNKSSPAKDHHPHPPNPKQHTNTTNSKPPRQRPHLPPPPWVNSPL